MRTLSVPSEHQSTVAIVYDHYYALCYVYQLYAMSGLQSLEGFSL